MGLETGSFVDDLVTTNPLSTDKRKQGDDHLRLIKALVKASLPGLDHAVYLETAQADVASGSTTNIGAAESNFVRITGTTTITAFDTVAAGIHRLVRFAGALTLTHNATSLILPGGANITTAADDRMLAMSLGSGNWIVLWYQAASGGPVVWSVPTEIVHTGDTNNKIAFGTDTQDFQTGGSSRLDLSDSGVQLGGSGARVTTVLDEDDMSTDSATALATQQSIKAYVDDFAKFKMGTYTGDGSTSQAITGVGFAPEYVRILPGATDGTAVQILETTSTLVDDDAQGLAVLSVTSSNAAMVDGHILSVDSDGFTVSDDGNDGDPNTDGRTYYYIAMRSGP